MLMRDGLNCHVEYKTMSNTEYHRKEDKKSIQIFCSSEFISINLLCECELNS